MAERLTYNIIERLTDKLTEKNLITKEQLEKAYESQKITHEVLGNTLVKLGFITEERLLSFIGEELDITNVNLKDYLIDPEIIKIVPERVARQYKIIPLFKIEDILTIAMADPLNVLAIDEIKAHVGHEIEPVITTEPDIMEAVSQYYGVKDTLSDIVASVEGHVPEFIEDKKGQVQKLQRIAKEPPVVRLVNLLITQAIQERASDIHIEPSITDLRIRFRVDGILHDFSTLPKHLQLSIISRIKIMANMDISERRVPQDGRIELKAGSKDIDLRISTYPSILGEKTVIRILDKSSALLSLEELGLSPLNLSKFKSIINAPYGFVLVTGPTGSGKSTSIYTILNTIKSEARNTITIEDPVEYQIGGITQAQINLKAGLSFADGLRAILRQDPDIIMIGEIRDMETAEIAVRSALTGHMVFSTLHTNDAASSITRLTDMGINAFLISSSITAIAAQRLARVICSKCKEAYSPSPIVLEELGLTASGEIKFYKGKGCKSCNGTGYKGRIGLFELLVIDQDIQNLITSKKPADSIKQYAMESGMKTLREDGIDKVLKGITTIDEIYRVTFGI